MVVVVFMLALFTLISNQNINRSKAFPLKTRNGRPGHIKTD